MLIVMFVCLQRGDRLYIGAPGSWYWQGKKNYLHLYICLFIDQYVNEFIFTKNKIQRDDIVLFSLQNIF